MEEEENERQGAQPAWPADSEPTDATTGQWHTVSIVSAAPASTRPGGVLLGLFLAIQFLTVLPVPAAWTDGAAADREKPFAMARALPWFPVVGALIGGVLALADWLLAQNADRVRAELQRSG